VADNDNWFVVWICFVELIEVVSQERCGTREGIAAGVGENQN
jgi:hypothetical protein